MQSTGQPRPSPPCQCQQQFGEALPWLVLVLVIVVALDRWNGRRRIKSVKLPANTTNSGPEEGAKK